MYANHLSELGTLQKEGFPDSTCLRDENYIEQAKP